MRNVYMLPFSRNQRHAYIEHICHMSSHQKLSWSVDEYEKQIAGHACLDGWVQTPLFLRIFLGVLSKIVEKDQGMSINTLYGACVGQWFERVINKEKKRQQAQQQGDFAGFSLDQRERMYQKVDEFVT